MAAMPAITEHHDMSVNDPRLADRYAFFIAYDQVCAYCKRPLDWDEFEIEHILPRRLAKDPAEWLRTTKDWGLADGFEVDSDGNRMASCGRCNREKGADLLPNFGMLLRTAREKAPKVEKLRTEYFTNRKVQKLKAQVEFALGQNPDFRQDIYSHLSIDISTVAPASSTPWVNEAAYQRAKDLLGAASRSLLTCPQTTNGHWFDRNELHDLVAALSNGERRLLGLIGPPGSGKSALLARLGNQLVQQGQVLLAIKADMLPSSINNIRELDKWLQVPEPLSIIIERLSADHSVTILIDQLDALSELMDVHSERLSALIALMDRILLSKTVRVIFSCREFDAQHDIRICSLMEREGVNTLRLGDLNWKPVKDFLCKSEFSPELWPEAVRKVLCRPNALNIFVKHFRPEAACPAFETYQSMLEQILQEGIVRLFGPETLAALYTLAEELADREELWVPFALFENCAGEDIDRLRSAGWIEMTPDGLRLGFAHQTMFDFVRARSFVSWQTSLYDEVKRRQDGLAIRPVLWSAATYLRTADRNAYCRQISALLGSVEIRPHIKLLLIDFLGAVTTPSFEEACWLKPLFRDAQLRPHVMQAIHKHEGWFRLLRTEIAQCNRWGEDAANQAASVLSHAIRFDQPFVLDLIENSWLKNAKLDFAIFMVFRGFEGWETRSASIVRTVFARTTFAISWVCMMAESIAKVMPETAIQIVRHRLYQQLQLAKAECGPIPEPPPMPASPEEWFPYHRAVDKALAPLTQLLRSHGEWHGLQAIASRAPAELVEGIWPWVEALSAELEEKGRSRVSQYRDCSEWRLGEEFGSYISQALWSAVSLFARADADRFLKWVNESSQSEWMAIHELIVHGLLAITSEKPQAAAYYLLQDPRRLAIRKYVRRKELSRRLLEAIAPFLTETLKDQLKRYIAKWEPYGTADPEREQWNEEERSRLVSVIDATNPNGGSIEAKEEDEEYLVRGGFVKSPITADELAELSDSAILSVVDAYPDTRGADLGSLNGGGPQVAAAFGEFVSKQPERGVGIIQMLAPCKQEYAAGHGLDAIAKSERMEPECAIQLARELKQKGFSSSEFTSLCGWAMVNAANRSNGLSDDSINFLLDSIQAIPERIAGAGEIAGDDAPPVFKVSQQEGKKRECHSVLWDHHGGPLSQGNLPFLLAISLGLLRRPKPDYQRLMSIIEEHLERKEDPAVWRDWLRYVRYTAYADTRRFLNIVSALLNLYPEIFCCVEGVVFIAHVQEALPFELFERIVKLLEASRWNLAEIAIGELVLLRRALVPDDPLANLRFDRIMDSEQSEVKLGVVRSAAETWREARLRNVSHEVLVTAIPESTGEFAMAVMQAFSPRDGVRVPADQFTSELLCHVGESANVLTAPTNTYLVECLNELLEKDCFPIDVANVGLALVTANAESIRKMSGGLSGEELVDTAVTLQKFPETRAQGTSIFECLLLANAYKAADAARELDRRF